MAMAGEGQEHRSKHRQEVDGSGSSKAPTTHLKKLAKRARPISLREESSLEGSPPRGGTPKSPDEIEYLKIHAPDCQINQEEVDYNKEDPQNIITL
jgi:hypothetical protein